MVFDPLGITLRLTLPFRSVGKSQLIFSTLIVLLYVPKRI